MTLASQVSIHLGQPVSEHKGELGINLTIPGVSLFVRNGQEVCPEACANTLRIMAEKRTYRDHLNETLKEELPDDLKRLLERLNSDPGGSCTQMTTLKSSSSTSRPSPH